MKPLHDKLDLCNRAAELLKAAGFVLHYTSRKTEACYYRWPDREELIRVAAHRRSKHKSRMQPKVVARITVNGTHLDPPGMCKMGEGKLEVMVAHAIGFYFLRSTPTVLNVCPICAQPAGARIENGL